MLPVLRWNKDHKQILRTALPFMALGMVLVTEPFAHADSVTSSVSLIVSQAAAVTTPVQSIVVVPTVADVILQNPTSNLGFGAPAPVAPPETVTATSTTPVSATAETSAATSAAQLPGSSSLASAAGFSAPASFGVAGSPNQVFSITLPSSIAYSSGGSVITLTNIGHNGGQTPAVGGGGAGTFAIGASVSGGSSFAGDAGNQAVASVGEPFLPVIVSYN